jgi:putative polyketide hydroxylase
MRIDLDVHRVGADGLTDPTGEFLSAFGIDSRGAVLVRPDGFVAWRAKTSEGASTAKMESALSTILSR